jgi:D-alanine-D-alanine ligase
MSRTDMIIKDDIIYVIELNTIPGMTEFSLYPQAAKAAGIEFPDLLDRLIQIAVETHKHKKRYKG